MEYQKSQRHGTSQRPDIIFHIPAEYSRELVTENNFAVWALKRRASESDARSDFDRLDVMFETLHYQLGFFVNVDSADPMLRCYTGAYSRCLAAVAARLTDARILVRWAVPDQEP